MLTNDTIVIFTSFYKYKDINRYKKCRLFYTQQPFKVYNRYMICFIITFID